MVTIPSLNFTGQQLKDALDALAGAGVPTGGTAGQVLAKASATDFDTAWVDQAAGGACGPMPGGWFLLSKEKQGYANVGGNNIALAPFVSDVAFTALPGMPFGYQGPAARVVAFSDNNGVPDDLIFYGTEDLVPTAAGQYHFHTNSINIPAGRVWLGVHSSGNCYVYHGRGGPELARSTLPGMTGGDVVPGGLIYPQPFVSGAPASLTGVNPSASTVAPIVAFSL